MGDREAAVIEVLRTEAEVDRRQRGRGQKTCYPDLLMSIEVKWRRDVDRKRLLFPYSDQAEKLRGIQGFKGYKCRHLSRCPIFIPSFTTLMAQDWHIEGAQQ